MRSINSMKSMITAMIANGANIILGFVVRAIFVRTLGAEYLGLNGLFGNIISMLAIIELGIGSAIIYHLYKPVAENDVDKIKKLMAFYKKCFNIIALLVLVARTCSYAFFKFSSWRKQHRRKHTFLLLPIFNRCCMLVSASV